jgi:hypothetical protein
MKAEFGDNALILTECAYFAFKFTLQASEKPFSA